VRTFATYVIACSSHGFTNPETTNPELLLFFVEFFGFFDKDYGQFLIYFDSQMKMVLAQIKTNSNFSENKSGFIDSEFVETCDEHFTSWGNGYLFLAQARILIIFLYFFNVSQ